MNIKRRIKSLLEKLNQGVYEKEEVIALSLLSAIAGESIFLLGMPGVAKSLVARKLKNAFQNASSFEYLMNRFSTPDEIFGPISISKLKNEDKYERIIKNYLPTANVVFLDEIWKAGPSIQNALLTVLNEKIYRNGDEEIIVPMKALIAASNELPSQGEGLEALWDRFLVRLVVEGVKDRNNFNAMISKDLNSAIIDNGLKISDKTYKYWDNKINTIEVEEDVFDIIHMIRCKVDQYNEDNKEQNINPIYVSDRRWRKIIRLLRTAAFLNGNKKVDIMDCYLIKHCIWNEVDEIEIVSTIVKESLENYLYSSLNIDDLKEEIISFSDEIEYATEKIIQGNIKIPVEYKDSNNNIYYKNRGNYNYNSRWVYILKSDFDFLDNNKQSVEFYDRNYYQRTNEFIIKGNEEYSLWIVRSYGYGRETKEEFLIETKTINGNILVTEKPSEQLKAKWQGKISKYNVVIASEKNDLEKYVNDLLVYKNNNIFSNNDFIANMKAYLESIENELEGLQIELRKIQSYYETLETRKIPLQNA